MTESTCIIDEVVKNKNYEKPLIVSFKQGQQRIDQPTEIEFKLYKQKCPKEINKSKLHLVAESKSKAFTGAAHNSGGIKHCVGVLDKHSGKLKIYEAELFDMSYYVENEERNDEEKNNLTESIVQNRDALTTSFGSKRKIRAIESRDKYAVGNEQLDVVMKQTTDNVVAPEINNDFDSNSFLTINWEAKSLHEVYYLNEIVTVDELSLLDDIAKKFSETEPDIIDTWKKESIYQPFILKRFEKFKEPNMIGLLQMLLYLHYLILFFQLKAAEIRKREPLPQDVPFPIRQKIIQTYTQTSVNAKNIVTKSAPPELKDKLLAHIIALGLTLNDFKIDMQEIKCVKYSRERLGLLGRMIGARLVGDKSSKMLELKLPLTKFTGIVKKKSRK